SRPAVGDATRSGGGDRPPVPAKLGEDAVARSTEDGQTSRGGMERAGPVQTQVALARPDRGADELRRRAGRIPRGDASFHGVEWYRVNPALQGLDAPPTGGPPRLPVSASPAARRSRFPDPRGARRDRRHPAH